MNTVDYYQNTSIQTTDIANTPDFVTTDIDGLISFALLKEYVLGARGFQIDDNIVIAVLTTPFYLKSERDNARILLEEELQNLVLDCNVIVTFDMHIYRNIRNNLSDDTKLKLFRQANGKI